MIGHKFLPIYLTLAFQHWFILFLIFFQNAAEKRISMLVGFYETLIFIEQYLKRWINNPIKIRNMEMNRIQTIKTFLEDYKSLNPHLKELTKEVHHHHQLELIQEYIKVSHHPFANEYLHPS